MGVGGEAQGWPWRRLGGVRGQAQGLPLPEIGGWDGGDGAYGGGRGGTGLALAEIGGVRGQAQGLPLPETGGWDGGDGAYGGGRGGTGLALAEIEGVRGQVRGLPLPETGGVGRRGRRVWGWEGRHRAGLSGDWGCARAGTRPAPTGDWGVGRRGRRVWGWEGRREACPYMSGSALSSGAGADRIAQSTWEGLRQLKPVYLPCVERADESQAAQRGLVRPYGDRYSECFDRDDSGRSGGGLQHVECPDCVGRDGLCVDGVADAAVFRSAGRPSGRALAGSGGAAVDGGLLLCGHFCAGLFHADHADDGRLAGERGVPSAGRDECGCGGGTQGDDGDLRFFSCWGSWGWP